MSFLYHTLVYNPLYNGLIGLMDAFPMIDVGVAVIIFTIIVKIILFPLSYKAARTQILMRVIEPKLREIKEKIKDPREAGLATLAAYREHKLNPFSSIFLILIQIPIIFALFAIFKNGLPVVQTEYLYSFVKVPEFINMHLFGLIDLSERHIWFAIVVALTQALQIQLTLPKLEPKKPENTGKKSFGEDLTRNMHFQMKYILPIFVGIGAATLPAVISVYWVVGSIFAICQELYIKKTLREKSDLKPIA